MSAIARMMPYWRETLGLRAFGFAKVPLLFFCQPSVVEFSDSACAVRVPLTWRTRNHMRSMYFGALAVGADCAGGLMAVMEIRRRKAPVSFVFKDLTADFISRPKGDVVFRCAQGQEIRSYVDRAISSDERVNATVDVVATVPTLSADPVAAFKLTLSMRRTKGT